VTAINDWASAATHGKIARVLTEPLPDTTMLFIANAVYFKGKWATPFDSSATGPHGFTLRSGRRISVPMMHRTGKLLYWRESGYQMVSLPYEGGHVAMYVILPDSSDATALASRFAAHGFPVNLSAPSARLVNLTLPRLHVEQKIDLGPLLERLGAGIAFDCRRADFGDMALDTSGQPYHPLCIGKATQNVYFDVDEKGTEAAAVTGIGMVTATAAQIPIDFVVDRPFLLVLRDESTGANLFVASIRHP
jgi:serpin B